MPGASRSKWPAHATLRTLRASLVMQTRGGRLDGRGMAGSEGNQKAAIARQDRAPSGDSSLDATEVWLVWAALAFASRSRTPLSNARTSSAVVRECCNMISITGSANNSSMVGSRLLMYMVMLTPTRSNRAGKPGTAGGRGSRGWPCWLPESRMAGDLKRGVSLNRTVCP
jgi:hypothetical protein